MAVTALNSEEGVKMPKDEATIDEQSVDTSSEANELEAYFDDPDAEVESVDAEETEAEEVEESEEDSPASEDEPDDAEEDKEAEEEPEQPAQNQQEEADTASEEPKQEEEKPKKGEPDPELAREAFKRREAERKLREAQQRQEAENLQRYLDDAKEDEAELAKRQIEVEAYVLNKERSEVLQEKLDVSLEKAVIDLGLKDMDEVTRNFIGRRLDEFEATRVVRDKQGNIVKVQGDVYQYLKEEMDSIQSFRSSGAREQTKKKTVELSRTVPKPTRTPKEKPVDDDMAAFAEEADKW